MFGALSNIGSSIASTTGNIVSQKYGDKAGENSWTCSWCWQRDILKSREYYRRHGGYKEMSKISNNLFNKTSLGSI